MAAIATFNKGAWPARRAWAQFREAALGVEESAVELPPFRVFLAAHTYTDDGGGAKFEPWRWQLELAEWLSKIRLLICLKGRQVGFTTMMSAYALHTSLGRGNKCLLFSQGEREAIKFAKKCSFAYDRLPDAMQAPGCRTLTQLLDFPDRSSYIEAYPATGSAGRSVSAARLALFDEYAMHPAAGDTMAAVKPAVESNPEGQVFIFSTADGIGNAFHRQWSAATGTRPWVEPYYDEALSDWTFGDRLALAVEALPQGEWLALFLPYNCRPGRDGAWRERERQSYAASPAKFEQEYPRDPSEAFVQSGRPVFAKECLERQAKLCLEPISQEQWPEPLRDGVRWATGSCRLRPEELRIFELPEPGHTYCSGADVAEGLAHGDYSDLSVIDLEDGREVLTLHGHWPTDVFGRVLDAIYRLYPGTHAPERNNHGFAVLNVLKELGTPGVYREVTPFDQVTAGDFAEGRLGWVTNSVTKPLMIDELDQAIRLGGILLSDALAIPELTFYRTNDNGSTSAPTGMHDDRVISRAIAWQMRKHRPKVLDFF